MNSQDILREANLLGQSEKIWLVASLWDCIEDQTLAQFSEEQLAELRRRDDYFTQHPEESLSARDAVFQLREKLSRG